MYCLFYGQGYSRIPVFKGRRSNVVYILFARDLLFIDPDDKKPLEEVCKFYQNEVNFVYKGTILTDIFKGTVSRDCV
jgi:metal transporter CNNM